MVAPLHGNETTRVSYTEMKSIDDMTYSMTCCSYHTKDKKETRNNNSGDKFPSQNLNRFKNFQENYFPRRTAKVDSYFLCFKTPQNLLHKMF